MGLPWGRRWLPEEDGDQLFRPWAERDLYRNALDGLPQALCHLDLFGCNLFSRKTADGRVQTEVINFAFTGRVLP